MTQETEQEKTSYYRSSLYNFEAWEDDENQNLTVILSGFRCLRHLIITAWTSISVFYQSRLLSKFFVSLWRRSHLHLLQLCTGIFHCSTHYNKLSICQPQAPDSSQTCTLRRKTQPTPVQSLETQTQSLAVLSFSPLRAFFFFLFFYMKVQDCLNPTGSEGQPFYRGWIGRVWLT